MSGLVYGFSARMRKPAASAQGEIVPSFEVPSGKRPKLFDLDEEAEKSPTVINVESPNRAFGAELALEDAPLGASKEACVLSEGGILTGGSPGAKGAMVEASLEVVPTPLFLSRLVSVGPHRLRMPDQLLLSSYVPPQEWVHPLADIVAFSLEGTREIINCWSLFNKRESSVKNMRDVYPTILWVPTAARFEQYSISFPGYLDRETF